MKRLSGEDRLYSAEIRMRLKRLVVTAGLLGALPPCQCERGRGYEGSAGMWKTFDRRVDDMRRTVLSATLALWDGQCPAGRSQMVTGSKSASAGRREYVCERTLSLE